MPVSPHTLERQCALIHGEPRTPEQYATVDAINAGLSMVQDTELSATGDEPMGAWSSQKPPQGIYSPMSDHERPARIPRHRPAAGAGIFVIGVIAGLSAWALVATLGIALTR